MLTQCGRRQVVRPQLPKLVSAGSSPVARSIMTPRPRSFERGRMILVVISATREIQSGGTMESKLNCMSCGTTACEYTDREEPGFCAQGAVSSALHDEAQRLYALPDVIMQAAAMVSEETVNSTRVQDTIKFANLISAIHIGIASCTIMLRETRILAKLLEQAGFCVETVGCKLESNRRADLDLEPPARGGEGGVVCNPIMQALLLNEAKTDLNILMGICVGHDALFCKYSDARRSPRRTSSPATTRARCYTRRTPATRKSSRRPWRNMASPMNETSI